MSPYGEAPFIVIWEMTRACDLACKHCRAAAVPMRHPEELGTAEALALVDDLAAMRPVPLFVLTGGDPAKRPDLVEIVRYAAGRGIRVSITPSATPLVTPELIRACVEAGLARWAFSLDGPDAASHDFFRGQAGSFALTLRAIAELRRLRMPLQINTTLSRYNRDSLPAIGALVEEQGATLWSLFLLVPTGRGRIEDALDAAGTEAALEWLYGFAAKSRCDVKTTEAPQWNRLLAQRGALPRPAAPLRAGIGRAPRPVTDGDGFIFVSHKGEVYPSGFLPVVVGSALTGIDATRLGLPPEELGRLDPVMAVAIGLALPAPKDVKQLDLLPPEFVLRRLRRRTQRSVIVVAVVIVAAMAGLGVMRFLKVHDAENTVASLKTQVATLQAEIPKYDKVQREQAAILADSKVATPIVTSEVNWPAVIAALQKYVPSGGTITSFSGGGATPVAAAPHTVIPPDQQQIASLSLGILAPAGYPYFDKWYLAIDGSHRLVVTTFSGISKTGTGNTTTFTAQVGVTGLITSSRVDEFKVTP